MAWPGISMQNTEKVPPGPKVWTPRISPQIPENTEKTPQSTKKYPFWVFFSQGERPPKIRKKSSQEQSSWELLALLPLKRKRNRQNQGNIGPKSSWEPPFPGICFFSWAVFLPPIFGHFRRIFLGLQNFSLGGILFIFFWKFGSGHLRAL